MKRNSFLKATGLVAVFTLSMAFSPNIVQAFGGTVTCYSESRSKSGATYYDCGSCTKQYNARSHGESSTCSTGGPGGGGPVIEEAF